MSALVGLGLMILAAVIDAQEGRRRAWLWIGFALYFGIAAIGRLS